MTTDPDCITGKHRACVNAVWDDETVVRAGESELLATREVGGQDA